MKKLSIILSLAVVLISCNGNSQSKFKRYNVKSGIVEYTTTTSGKMMGSSIEGKGVQYLYFKNWGAIELQEEESTQTSSIKFFGKAKKEVEEKHAMNKLENGKNYIVNFDNKTIDLMNVPAMSLMDENTNAEQAERDMLVGMGGEKIGEESYQGYKCEIWEIMGAKQWVHKGVMLKMEMSTMGIETLTEATSVKFNVNVPEKYFELPDFPVQQSENYLSEEEYEAGMEEMDASMDKIANLSYEEWKKGAVENDEEMRNMSEEELRQTYDMIQKMIKMRKGN